MAEPAYPADNPFGYELLHLSPVIGTEVLGIDIGSDLPPAVIDWLAALLVERKVRFFRGQPGAHRRPACHPRQRGLAARHACRRCGGWSA